MGGECVPAAVRSAAAARAAASTAASITAGEGGGGICANAPIAPIGGVRSAGYVVGHGGGAVCASPKERRAVAGAGDADRLGGDETAAVTGAVAGCMEAAAWCDCERVIGRDDGDALCVCGAPSPEVYPPAKSGAEDLFAFFDELS